MTVLIIAAASLAASLLLGLAVGAVLRWCGRHDDQGQPSDRAQAELMKEKS